MASGSFSLMFRLYRSGFPVYLIPSSISSGPAFENLIVDMGSDRQGKRQRGDGGDAGNSKRKYFQSVSLVLSGFCAGF